MARTGYTDGPPLRSRRIFSRAHTGTDAGAYTNTKMPVILPDYGPSYLPLRQLERSQLASPWGLW